MATQLWGGHGDQTVSDHCPHGTHIAGMQRDEEQLGCVRYATSGWMRAKKDNEAGEGAEGTGKSSQTKTWWGRPQ